MNRFAGLLGTEIGSCRVEVIVVSLPYHRRPARMAHPDEKALTAGLRALEHCPVAVIVYPLGPFGELLCT